MVTRRTLWLDPEDGSLRAIIGAGGERAALLSECTFSSEGTRAAITSVTASMLEESTRELEVTTGSGSVIGEEILGEASGDASDKVAEEP